MLTQALLALSLLGPARALAQETNLNDPGSASGVLHHSHAAPAQAVPAAAVPGAAVPAAAVAASSTAAAEQSPPRLRLLRGADLQQAQPPRSEGPYKIARGERVAACVNMSPQAYREAGPLKLFADKKHLLGTLGYHRGLKCANLHGLALSQAGRRTLDVQKNGAWWLTVELTVE